MINIPFPTIIEKVHLYLVNALRLYQCFSPEEPPGNPPLEQAASKLPFCQCTFCYGTG